MTSHDPAAAAALTTLERRALDRLLTPGGNILIVAADQRNGMKAVMPDAPRGSAAVTKQELAFAKRDLVSYLANATPAVLLDPEIALPAVVDEAVISAETALVVGMDASGFDVVDGLRVTRYVEGISPRRVRELGGDVAKMLFYLRPDRQGLDSEVADQIRQLTAACAAEGLLLIVEILVYQLEDESDDEYADAYPELIIESARFSVLCGAKVLKLQYPGSREASARVTAAAAGAPWAVLSAGVDHETFITQVEEAVVGGAAGAMAGRSLWKDSITFDEVARRELLERRAKPRAIELQTTIDRVSALREA